LAEHGGAEGVGPAILGEKVITDHKGGGHVDTTVPANGEQCRCFHFHAHNSLGLVTSRLRHGLPVMRFRGDTLCRISQSASAETPPIRIWSMTERDYDSDVSTETLAHAVAGEDEFPRRRL
jgi:hypothetical protein